MVAMGFLLLLPWGGVVGNKEQMKDKKGEAIVDKVYV